MIVPVLLRETPTNLIINKGVQMESQKSFCSIVCDPKTVLR